MFPVSICGLRSINSFGEAQTEADFADICHPGKLLLIGV